MCQGDILLYCGVPTDPCWSGSQKFEKDCAASGLRCFSADENGCGGMCLPVTDSEPDEQPDDDESELDVDEYHDVDEYPDADCLMVACYDFTIKVSGAVANEGGTPIPGIAVALYDDGVISSPQFMSNEDGVWLIEYAYGECGGTDEGVVDAKVIATDIDGSTNGVYVETVIDFSPWNVKNDEWVPPCINSDIYLEELGVQIVMLEQPDDDTLLTDAN